jgi:hypothetical protein
MTNFTTTNPQEVIDFVFANLPSHDLMAIATTNSDGSPWVVCVNLSYDKKLNIIWKSARNAEHSKNIATNNQVSICVFSKLEGIGDFGFYSQGTAYEISDIDELNDAIKVKYEQKELPVPPIIDFQGDAPVRLYKATLSKVWVTDDRHLKIPVNLDLLR